MPHKCVVLGCERRCASDALVCREHLNDLWANRLERSEDGFVERVPEWVRRAGESRLPAKEWAA